MQSPEHLLKKYYPEVSLKYSVNTKKGRKGEILEQKKEGKEKYWNKKRKGKQNKW